MAEVASTAGKGCSLVLLGRHAQAAVPDEEGRYFSEGAVPLSEKGHQQARLLAEALSGLHVDRMWLSDFLRGAQTAEHLAAPPRGAPRSRESAARGQLRLVRRHDDRGAPQRASRICELGRGWLPARLRNTPTPLSGRPEVPRRRKRHGHGPTRDPRLPPGVRRTRRT